MGSTLVIVLGVLVLLLLVLAIVAARAQGSRDTGWLSGVPERERAMAAQADVEEHDIEQMIEARNALRRRIGRPPIGDELAEEVRDERE